ncbi:MAG: hypothetical protein SPL10_00725 [Synergistales bacterium]|nr:hypothetical protein [Synergistales bacterium]MDY6401700.1 hypothetical protein [Synergistales bacterium]MDY6404508.1 hypothetical protein [Synergistales bacterium]MDY6410580.1 hypothetical protein [Synergistales bacterium]MDY6413667.1 hypothetical protein [Synergistales bacterium]
MKTVEKFITAAFLLVAFLVLCSFATLGNRKENFDFAKWYETHKEFVKQSFSLRPAYADDAEEIKRRQKEWYKEYEKDPRSKDMSFNEWLKEVKGLDPEKIDVDPTNPDDWSKDPDSKDQQKTSPDNKLYWAQEPSQIAIAVLTLVEMLKLHGIRDDQKKMLETWSESVITNPRDELLTNLYVAASILNNSPFYSEVARDLDGLMSPNKSKRFPEWKSGMTIAQSAKRINDRQTKWKSSVKEYLRAVNRNTSHFKDIDLKIRNALMEIVKKPAGQTQALQAIGGYLDNMNIMFERDGQALQGIMGSYIERKLDKIDERNDRQKAVNEVAVNLKNYKPKTKKCKLGF